MKRLCIISLKRIDLFAQPVQIKFNNEKKFSTVLGGIICLIIYAVTIAITYEMGVNVIRKRNPKITMSNNYEVSSQIVNISEVRMISIATIVTRNFELINDPTIMKIEMSHFIVKEEKNETKSYNNLPLEFYNCSNYFEYFKEKGFAEEYKISKLNQGVCFDINNEDLLIGGNFLGEKFSNIKYNVKKCKNSTDSDIICQPEEIINDKLQGGFFQLYYVNSNIDINNYEKPFNDYFHNFFVYLDPASTKLVDLYFGTVNIESDVGIMFQEQVNQYKFVFDDYREQIDTSTNGDEMIEFYINSSNNNLKYSRIYLKLQDLTASIHGLIRIMIMIGSFVNLIFSNSKMYEKMVNSLFVFKDENFSSINNFVDDKIVKLPFKIVNNENTNNNHISSHRHFLNLHQKNKNKELNVINSPNLANSNEIKEINLAEQKLNDVHIINSIKTHIKKTTRAAKLILGPFEVIRMYFCHCFDSKQNNKRKIFDFAMKKLNKYFDYLEIIKTLQQFHKLKKILFNKTQKKLFNFQKKPEISLEKINLKYDINPIIISLEEKEYLDLYKSYTKAKNKTNIKTYNKLIGKMDNEIKNLFEGL